MTKRVVLAGAADGTTTTAANTVLQRITGDC